MTPLESRLTAALAADVVRFDSPDAERQTLLLDSERFEPDLVPLRLDGRSPRHGRTTAGVAAAALLCLAIVATVVRRDDDSRGSDTGSVPSSTSSAVVHPGIEQPLVETAAGPVQDAYKPGSVHAFSVEGHPDLLLWTTLSINPATGAPEEFQCVSEVGSSGCGPTSIPAQFGQTSSIDNGFATDDLFTWINLPADVDTVEYDDGFVQLWQRPVAGLAIFRVDPNHPHPSIKAVEQAHKARLDGKDDRYPLVTLEAEMYIFLGEYPDGPDAWPDRVLRFGPRGGIQHDKA